MSVNVEVKTQTSSEFPGDNEDVKITLRRLRKRMSQEGYRQPDQFFIKPSTKKYRRRKKAQHLAKLKRAKDNSVRSRYRQPRPIDKEVGADYRRFLWRKYADGMTFLVPKLIRRSPWQNAHSN